MSDAAVELWPIVSVEDARDEINRAVWRCSMRGPASEPTDPPTASWDIPQDRMRIEPRPGDVALRSAAQGVFVDWRRASSTQWLNADGTSGVRQEGPVELRLQVTAGDVITVQRGTVPPAVGLPFQRALARVAELYSTENPKRGDAWREQSCAEHASRSARHSSGAMVAGTVRFGDGARVELVHAACRALMALELFEEGSEAGDVRIFWRNYFKDPES